MKLDEIVQTDSWKNFMKYLYGWGAAVVLLGALFKIQHWPGASLMLILGMGTEVFIFFFSAFEPIHGELDWTLVYPELAGLEFDENGNAIGGGHGHGVIGAVGAVGAVGEKPSDKISGLKKLEVMMESVEVNTSMFETLGKGLNSLSKTTSNLTDITDATVATKEYATQVRSASQAVGGIVKAFDDSKVVINDSCVALSGSYNSSAELIKKSGEEVAAKFVTTADLFKKSGEEVASKFVQTGNDLLSSYQLLGDSIKNSANTVSTEGKAYAAKIDVVNKNLGAINSVYELQLQETNQHLTNTKDVFKGFANMMSNLKESAEETKKYRDEVAKLSGNISELNNVYGNMLSSLNLITNLKS